MEWPRPFRVTRVTPVTPVTPVTRVSHGRRANAWWYRGKGCDCDRQGRLCHWATAGSVFFLSRLLLLGRLALRIMVVVVVVAGGSHAGKGGRGDRRVWTYTAAPV